jgi:flagellar biosynthetic protein FlhB
MAEETEDESSKTEEPTPKKLEEARKKGEIILSREINHWFMILAATLYVFLLAGPSFAELGNALRAFIERPHGIAAGDGAAIGVVLKQLLYASLIALALPFLAFLLAALAGSMIQTGALWAPENIMPKLDRISLIKGFGRLFSLKNVLEFVKGILKLAVVAVVVVALVWPILPGLEHVIDVPVATMLAELKIISLRVLGGVLAIMFVVMVLDYLLQRLLFLQRMRMTRSELKEEYKQAEGDPQVKQKIRQIRSERARRRMMASVPQADVVVTNPDHYAVALEYKPPQHAAPVVLAMGVDLIAQKIKEIAKENDIPIVENPPLARALYATAEIDREIPGEHYRAVAEIISYVYKLKNKLPKKP